MRSRWSYHNVSWKRQQASGQPFSTVAYSLSSHLVPVTCHHGVNHIHTRHGFTDMRSLCGVASYEQEALHYAWPPVFRTAAMFTGCHLCWEWSEPPRGSSPSLGLGLPSPFLSHFCILLYRLMSPFLWRTFFNTFQIKWKGNSKSRPPFFCMSKIKLGNEARHWIAR